MTYGAEAIIPLENGFPTMRSSAFTLDKNNELLKKNLDLIEEATGKCYGAVGLLSAQV